MKYDFITIGGAVIDETFKTREGDVVENKKNTLKQKLIGFEYGAKVPISDYNLYFGGGAANAAVSLSRLGYRAAAFVQIGNDERGLKIVANFKKEKVSSKFVKVSRNLPTGFSFIVVAKDGEHIAFTYRGANDALSINFAEKRALNQAKWLHLASLSGSWIAVLDKVFSVAGVRFAWNPGNVQLSAGLRKISRYMKKTDVFFLNKAEAIKLISPDIRYKKKSVAFLHKPENLLKIISSHGPKISIVTCGSDGAYAYDGKKVYFEKPIKVDQVADTTGVGDAFSSAFVAGLERYNGNIKKSMKLGMKNAAYILRKPGAQNGLMKA